MRNSETAVYIRMIETPLGEMIACSDGKSLCGLWFKDRPHFPSCLLKNGKEGWLPVFEETEQWLRTYFNEEIPNRMPKLSLNGSAYQRRIWAILEGIPYGETASYQRIAELANETNHDRAACAQAAGQAVSRNPVSLIVPCHRVIGKNGRMRGYAGGLDRKAFLLEMEKRVIGKKERESL